MISLICFDDIVKPFGYEKYGYSRVIKYAGTVQYVKSYWDQDSIFSVLDFFEIGVQYHGLWFYPLTLLCHSSDGAPGMPPLDE
jgi:hypothetical protein